MTTIQVYVQQRHIDAGTQCVADRCPIALALNEMGFEHVDVDARIRVGDGWFAWSVPTPASAKIWMHAFDETVFKHAPRVKPFRFVLNLRDADQVFEGVLPAADEGDGERDEQDDQRDDQQRPEQVHGVSVPLELAGVSA